MSEDKSSPDNDEAAAGTSPRGRSFPESVQSVVQKAWTDARSAGAGVEGELRRRFRTLLDRSGFQQGSEEVQRIVSGLNRRFQRNQEEIERRFQESMRRAVSKLRDPLVEELARLRGRAENIGQQIERQIKRRRMASQGQAGDGEASGDVADDRRAD